MRANQQLICLLAWGIAGSRILADFNVPILSSSTQGKVQTNITVRWKYETDGYVYTSPAIGTDGTVYFASVFGMVLAVDGKTGLEKWRYAITKRGRLASSPAIGPDGTLYIAGGDGVVYGLDGKTGSKRWSFDTSTRWAIYSSPTIGSNGIVYIGAMDKKVYALTADTGRKIWDYKTGGEVWSSASLNREETTIFIGSFDGKLYALDAASGELHWHFETQGKVYSTAAVDENGIVYTASEDGCVYALDGNTGAKKWSACVADEIWSSPALTTDNKVIIAARGGKVYALSRDNGSVLWTCSKVFDFLSSTPAIDKNGAFYVGSELGKVYAINSMNGTLLWQFTTGAPVYSSPAIGDDGTVYVGSNDGCLYALMASGNGLARSTWAKFKGNCRNTSQITLIVSGIPFAVWAQIHIPMEALRGSESDADADGLLNGLEYALRTEPMNPDLGNNYGSTLESSPLDPGWLTLTYREGKELQGVSFEIQTASKLPPVWSILDPPVSDISVDDLGTYYAKYVRIPIPPSDTSLFIRIVIKLEDAEGRP